MKLKFDLEHTKIVIHKIETTGPPVLVNPRTQPMHLESNIDDLIQNFLLAKIIRPCNSAWNSPLVIVRKKNDSIQMCLDFRRLNTVTKKSILSVPDINLMFNTLYRSKHFFIYQSWTSILSS